MYENIILFFLICDPLYSWGFPNGSEGKGSACSVGDLGLIPGLKDPLEERMATHSSILAWRIPGT